MSPTTAAPPKRISFGPDIVHDLPQPPASPTTAATPHPIIKVRVVDKHDLLHMDQAEFRRLIHGEEEESTPAAAYGLRPRTRGGKHDATTTGLDADPDELDTVLAKGSRRRRPGSPPPTGAAMAGPPPTKGGPMPGGVVPTKGKGKGKGTTKRPRSPPPAASVGQDVDTVPTSKGKGKGKVRRVERRRPPTPQPATPPPELSDDEWGSECSTPPTVPSSPIPATYTDQDTSMYPSPKSVSEVLKSAQEATSWCGARGIDAVASLLLQHEDESLSFADLAEELAPDACLAQPHDGRPVCKLDEQETPSTQPSAVPGTCRQCGAAKASKVWLCPTSGQFHDDGSYVDIAPQFPSAPTKPYKAPPPLLKKATKATAPRKAATPRRKMGDTTPLLLQGLDAAPLPADYDDTIQKVITVFGFGEWAYAKHVGLIPPSLDVGRRVQSMSKQQSVTAFSGLHLDMTKVAARNVRRMAAPPAEQALEGFRVKHRMIVPTVRQGPEAVAAEVAALQQECCADADAVVACRRDDAFIDHMFAAKKRDRLRAVRVEGKWRRFEGQPPAETAATEARIASLADEEARLVDDFLGA